MFGFGPAAKSNIFSVFFLPFKCLYSGKYLPKTFYCFLFYLFFILYYNGLKSWNRINAALIVVKTFQWDEKLISDLINALLVHKRFSPLRYLWGLKKSWIFIRDKKFTGINHKNVQSCMNVTKKLFDPGVLSLEKVATKNWESNLVNVDKSESPTSAAVWSL